MKREHLNSSCIHSVGYDADTETLEIKYVNGGVYHYFEVPLLVHKQLLKASSPGTFVITRIKPYYRFREIS
jgi:KTSC domain